MALDFRDWIVGDLRLGSMAAAVWVHITASQVACDLFQTGDSRRPLAQSRVLDLRPSPEMDGRIRDYERRIWTPASINFPAGMLEIPYDILSKSHAKWRPLGMDFLFWRDLSWRLTGIVFW